MYVKSDKFLMLNNSEHYSLANMLSWQHLKLGSLQLHLCSI